nr:phosphatidylinositol-specific phospholipase C [Streptomyces sp. GC420]
MRRSGGLLAYAGSAAPAYAATQDWMGRVADSTALQRLSIPGTHNAGARVGGPWVACQNIPVAEQLSLGVRFLDVRCRAFEGSFTIHHGAYYQNLNFTDVLVACRDFLAAHPSETVLMRLKQEYSEVSDAEFRAHFDDYLDNRGWRSLFRLDSALPDLGGARGKVVLLADNAGLPGVRWGNSALFDIQDEYMTEPVGKYPLVEAHFKKAVAQPGKLFVNHVSTAALLPPSYNAGQLNPRVKSFLTGSGTVGWTGLGIVPMDFPNSTPGLIGAVLAHNP